MNATAPNWTTAETAIEDATQARKLSHFISFAATHGFAAIPTADQSAVVVIIPWFNSTTRESGSHAFICRTWRDVRIALGY